jgi:hypothetical protein
MNGTSSFSSNHSKTNSDNTKAAKGRNARGVFSAFPSYQNDADRTALPIAVLWAAHRVICMPMY